MDLKVLRAHCLGKRGMGEGHPSGPGAPSTAANRMPSRRETQHPGQQKDDGPLLAECARDIGGTITPGGGCAPRSRPPT
jgi:hypothetical protein